MGDDDLDLFHAGHYRRTEVEPGASATLGGHKAVALGLRARAVPTRYSTHLHEQADPAEERAVPEAARA